MASETASYIASVQGLVSEKGRNELQKTPSQNKYLLRGLRSLCFLRMRGRPQKSATLPFALILKRGDQGSTNVKEEKGRNREKSVKYPVPR